VTEKAGEVVTIARPIGRLACLADVHANIAALDAVTSCDEFATVDAVAFLGCLTTGPEPRAVLERCARLPVPAYFLSGNGERSVLELAEGKTIDDWPIGNWILDHHGTEGVATIRSWPSGLIANVTGLGAVRLCHGSPRSDIELVTPRTAPARLESATRDIDEHVVVHGHTHLQYDRNVGAMRFVGAGSVGLPYTTGAFGARWAILSREVELIETAYDIGTARIRIEASAFPDPKFIETLEHPPSSDEVIDDCESRWFSN
jgi:diadenosine tetraphosphatase ApaH/serine/threonine PP2A family protein phosphatase